MEQELNQGAGDAGAGLSPGTDLGTGGGNSAQPSNPAGQGGNPTDQGQGDVEKYRQEVQRLNRALIEAKRGARQNPNQPQDGEDPWSTPQGQYAAALQIATGEVRSKFEDIASLYPEVDQKIISQIRRNPWAFASHQSYVNGDVDSALLEIETYMADMVEQSAGGGGTQPQQTPQPTPAQVNANAQTPPAPPMGEGEEDDPWTMPMDKLEQKARAEMRKKQAEG